MPAPIEVGEIRRGGLQIDHDGNIIPADLREERPVTPTLPELKLEILEHLIPVMQAANNRPDIESIAGRTLVESRPNPNFTRAIDSEIAIATRPMTDKERAYGEKSVAEKIIFLEQKLRLILSEYPDLRKQRIQGLIDETMQGRINFGENLVQIDNPDLQKLLESYFTTFKHDGSEEENR